jgi:signal transduction histidine kinase
LNVASPPPGASRAAAAGLPALPHAAPPDHARPWLRLTGRLHPWPAWPHSLVNRTLLTLLIGLAVVQGAGLTIHALDRIALQRLAEMHNIGMRAMGIYRAVVSTSVGEREATLHEMDLGPGVVATLSDNPPLTPDITEPPFARQIRVNMDLVWVRPANRPRDVMIRGSPTNNSITIGMKFPDRGWLDLKVRLAPTRPWHSPTFLLAFVLMTVAAAILSFWAVRRLTRPVTLLAEAAERLGRDVNAPPLPEHGPDEVVRAAVAFNTMAARIRRFVQDRTFLLTAIGHDLRTPITRLKLRAEFIDDDEQRQKFMADLDELDAMVSATLVFGRDTADTEPAVAFDLVALLRTVLDDAADARPDAADRLSFDGPAHLTVSGRILALKRSFANLVGNAVKYGGCAHVGLTVENGLATVTIEDEGPGLPPDELERIFEPFYRVEDSRNRETGGTGLGLPIARNILRAHGGDVVLGNRAGGGARAVVTVPA